MPSFKPKNTRKIIVNKKSTITLDNKHTQLMDTFNKELLETLPKLRQEKKQLKQKLKSNINTIDIQDKLDIQDKIKDINKQITQIKLKKKNYFLNNSKYIFDYFENKKLISEGNNKTKILNTYFNIDKNENNLKKDCYNNVQKYLINLDESFLNIDDFITSTDICQYCYKGELIPVVNEGILICNKCYKSVKFLIENEKPSYKEPPKEVCFYAYKRINHFREILAQFQAKETTQIPDEVIESIQHQIKKERITIYQLTNVKAKEILKKLGYNKYYEHIPFIKDKLGIKPPIMSPDLEDTLCNLFIDIQGPYAKYCPDIRVNFLNYYYTIYKLCELLDQRQFLPIFPMLKDREKRIEQDEIWKQICEELNWEFIPTV
jgi:hypothetical protein